MTLLGPQPAQPAQPAIDGILAGAQQLLGPETVARITELMRGEPDLVVLDGVISGVVEELESTCPRANAPLVDLAVRACDVRAEIRQRANEHRLALNEQVTKSLARLRGVHSTAELLDKVCVEVVRSCGVRRALLSRVEGDVWFPWMAHFPDDPDLETRFVQSLAGVSIALDDAPVERAVIASHAAQIVKDASPPRAYGPLIGLSRSTAYVVAPITSAGRIVGLLHADHHPDPTPVDEIDRDVIWAFADGFARIYERTETSERLREQSQHVSETLGLLDEIASSVVGTEIELTHNASHLLADSEALVSVAVQRPEAVDAQLTAREREVLELMALGRGNHAIAERLVIREGTVKSHVKHILRKLGAANRAEVISLTLGHRDR